MTVATRPAKSPVQSKNIWKESLIKPEQNKYINYVTHRVSKINMDPYYFYAGPYREKLDPNPDQGG